MEVGEDKKYTQLFDLVERRKKEKGEAAARFPATKEEYLEKPVDERMETAMDILREYARIGQLSPGPVRAEIIPDDRPDMILTGAVGYLPEERWRTSKHIPRRAFEAINVSVGAKEISTELETTQNERKGLGKIRKGSYVDGSGTNQEGWVVMLNDTLGTMIPLESELGRISRVC